MTHRELKAPLKITVQSLGHQKKLRDFSLAEDTYFTESGLVYARQIWDAIVPVVAGMEADGLSHGDISDFVKRVMMSVLTRENSERVMKRGKRRPRKRDGVALKEKR